MTVLHFDIVDEIIGSVVVCMIYLVIQLYIVLVVVFHLIAGVIRRCEIPLNFYKSHRLEWWIRWWLRWRVEMIDLLEMICVGIVGVGDYWTIVVDIIVIIDAITATIVDRLCTILIRFGRLNDRCLNGIIGCSCRATLLRSINLLIWYLTFRQRHHASISMRFKIQFTSKSDPLTISTNCLHFSMNNKFWLFSKSPGYDRSVWSIAKPIRPPSTSFKISVFNCKVKYRLVNGRCIGTTKTYFDAFVSMSYPHSYSVQLPLKMLRTLNCIRDELNMRKPFCKTSIQ